MSDTTQNLTCIWHAAMGLQAVDNLTPSGCLKELAALHIEGKMSIS